MSTKETLEQLVADLKDWQKIENAAVQQTGKIMASTESPLIRTVMEIIQRDSNMHHRVQQMIIDAMEKEVVHINVDDLAQAWDAIEKHIEIEKKTVQLATKAFESLKGLKYPYQHYLINYLLEDEKKHDKLLEDLRLIKTKMYPY